MCRSCRTRSALTPVTAGRVAARSLARSTRCVSWRPVGTVRLASCNAATCEPPLVTTTLGASAINSLEYLRTSSGTAAIQRTSIFMLRPVVQPRSCKACTNAVRRDLFELPSGEGIGGHVARVRKRRCHPRWSLRQTRSRHQLVAAGVGHQDRGLPASRSTFCRNR